MKSRSPLSLYPLLGLFLIVLTRCAGELKPAAPEETPLEAVPEAPVYLIADYQGREEGQAMPPWLVSYLAGRTPAVEALPHYENSYVFVGENRGTNRNILGQWLKGFTVLQDFPRLAAARIQARFTLDLSENPDKVYGRYFEQAVKAASDALFTGALRETDCWILKQYGDDQEDREELHFFVLVVVDKAALETQIRDILNGIPPDLAATKEQLSAVSRLQSSFFEGF
jgi:hypothetical protein